MLVLSARNYNTTHRLRSALGSYWRNYSSRLPRDAYKRVRLCDRPQYSLCRNSVELLRDGSSFSFLLDDHLLESPLGNVISTGSLPVAERILSEWRTQLGRLTRFEMVPTTMLLAETMDFSPKAHREIMDSMVNSLRYDTVLRFNRCPVVALPPLEELNDQNLSQIAKLDIDTLQSSYLMPILEGFASRRGTSRLLTSGALSACPVQHEDVIKLIEHTLSKLGVAQVITIWKLHRTLKSVILPLELLENALSASCALRASRLEETLHAANWGVSESLKDLECSLLGVIDTSLFFLGSYVDLKRPC